MDTNYLKTDAAASIDKIDGASVAQADTAREEMEKPIAKLKDVAGDARSKVCEHPVSCLLGAIIFGFAMGCLIVASRRHSQSEHRFVDRSLTKSNEWIGKTSDGFYDAASNLKNR